MEKYNISFNFMVMDLSKISIMSRGIEVDKAFCDRWRIRYIYNRIESIDMGGIDGVELHRLIRERMESGSKEMQVKVVHARGSCMMVEGGMKSTAGGGNVIVTTIFHFQDSYSMELFILKYPHKAWDHMKDLFIMTN